jgi:uncharacterized membrane protein YukC
MPKNWGGENSKSAQAKARKDAVRRDENEKKQKEAEDKYWEDNDKHVIIFKKKISYRILNK